MNFVKRLPEENISDGSLREHLKKGKYEDPVVQLGNRYDGDAEGPFMVILKDKREEHSLGNIHPMVIGKKFKQCKLEVANIDRYSDDKILILFNDAIEANNFVETTMKEIDDNWIAYIPNFALQHVGIVRDVPIDFNYEELLEGISDSNIKDNVVDIIRIKVKNTEKDNLDKNINEIVKLVNSDSIKIVFNNKLPDNIKIYCCVRKVLKFIPAIPIANGLGILQLGVKVTSNVVIVVKNMITK